MEMTSLPLVFSYAYTHKGTVVGDLVVTKGILYFMPHTDTSATPSIATVGGGGALYLAAHALVPVLAPVAHFGPELVRWAGALLGRSPLRKKNLLLDGDSSAMLQARLDDEIDRIARTSRDPKDFTTRLPRPTRLTTAQVTHCRLSRGGELQAATQYVGYKFGVGPHRRRRLNDALCEAGFLKTAR